MPSASILLNRDQVDKSQHILIFEQNGSGQSKIEGIRRYGTNVFTLEIVSINEVLPPVIDDTARFFSNNIEADLVLDFLIHPDLSYDLAVKCEKRNIPVVSSGRNHQVKGAITPFT